MKSIQCTFAFMLLAGWMMPAAIAARQDSSQAGYAVVRLAPANVPGMEDGQESRAEQAYEQGVQARDARDWAKAIESFSEVVGLKGDRADAALYWKAYAQNKLGARAAALETLAALSRDYAGSRWLNDARALDLEIRQASGQSVVPESEPDEDLKLMALNSLQQSDPERAVPLLKSILQGNQSLKIKERALFVLAQSRSPQAKEVLAEIARGDANPDLQAKAIRNLGLFGGRDSRQMLGEIYASSANPDAKRAVLNSYMVVGDQDRLLAVARQEGNPDLRREAIRLLGVLGASEQLWDLYRNEQLDPSGRKEILRALFVSGRTERLIEVARGEKDTSLRLEAIRDLGLMSREKTADTLVFLYESDTDASVRKRVIEALFVQNNATALVALARKEKDPSMKKAIVSKLSLMDSKEARDYMLELLKN